MAILHDTDTKEAAIILITQFVVWRERCSHIFREVTKDIEDRPSTRSTNAAQNICNPDQPQLHENEYYEWVRV